MSNERRRPNDNEFQMPSLRLDGRTALVTGGSRGLGLGIALALAHAGADIAIAARTESEIATACELIEATGRKTLNVPTDIANVAAVRAMVQQTHAHFGRLDILVNAAGMNIRQPYDTFTEDDWERLMGINLKGAFFAAQAAAGVMRAQAKGRGESRNNGKIINITSLATQVALPNVALYGISKSGLLQMTRALALELAPARINVNAIGPGRFWTAMTDKLFADPALYDNNVSMIPLGRPGIATDLAGAALLLASDAGDYITGQTIYVDGGWLANGGAKA
ncbi:MAG: glucose 1-dehydrogenase [Acidobacteria bacterium]|nr:glucose 1-dehydrogenase [Acidobacteriota bacterium]MBI3427026.1 glucose 1-dehydrogenase [Acidobacteriota bacterium]